MRPCSFKYLMMTLSASPYTRYRDQYALIHRRRATHLDVESLEELSDLVGVDTLVVDGTRGHLLLAHNLLPDSDTVIVLSERRRLVNDTGSGVRGNVLVDEDSESFLGVLQTFISDGLGSQSEVGLTRSL